MAATATPPLHFGWAQRDITPWLPTVLYGQFHARITNEIADPLIATAMAVSSGEDGEAVTMASSDRCTIPGPVARQCLQRISALEPGIDTSRVILNATHTHTSPWITEEAFPPQGVGEMSATPYAELFVEGVAQAAVEAWRSRRPGLVGWGMGHAVVGHNRRASYFRPYGEREGAPRSTAREADGHSKMYGKTDDPDFSHVEGYEDHSLDLLFTWDEQGELIGVIINLACPSQEVEGASYVSADFWHDIRVELRRRHGEGLCVLSQCGAAGDQSPHLLLHKRAEERMLRLRGLSMREEIARRVADGVDDVLPLAGMEATADVPLQHTFAEVPVDRWLVSEADLAMAQKDLADLEAEQPADARAASIHHVRKNRCLRVISRHEEQKTVPQLLEPVHVVRLGDVAFATNRFEFYLDYGERIKARSPALQTFVVQLAAGGAHTGTYLPTARSVAGGSYGAGAYCNEVGPEGGQQLVEHTLRMLGELWPEGAVG